jgi:DNA-binding transcriptional LysR family regulator
MSMVAAGQGVSLLPAFLSRLPIAGAVFRPLDLPRKKSLYMTYNLITTKIKRNAATENFIAVARETIKTMEK